MATNLFPTVQLARIGDADVHAVDARELHAKLEVRTPFDKWFPRRKAEAQLVENTDYCSIDNFVENPEGGRPRIDYLLTTDAAKHVAMLERNDRGREVRQYLIEVEKKWSRGESNALTAEQIALIATTAATNAVRSMLPELIEARIKCDKRVGALENEGSKKVCDRMGIDPHKRGGFSRSLTAILGSP